MVSRSGLRDDEDDGDDCDGDYETLAMNMTLQTRMLMKEMMIRTAKALETMTTTTTTTSAKANMMDTAYDGDGCCSDDVDDESAGAATLPLLLLHVCLHSLAVLLSSFAARFVLFRHSASDPNLEILMVGACWFESRTRVKRSCFKVSLLRIWVLGC